MSKIGAALSRLVSSVKADHRTMAEYQDRYQSSDGASSIAKDLVQKIGFQMMASYRVMRFLHEAEIPVAPKLASRAIRLVYGSDIHWEAEFEPGVVIVHGMGMAVSRSARVGSGSILFQNITLAESADGSGTVGGPQVGKNVHIGPGSALIGPIEVGDATKIVAGSTILESVPAGSRVEAPAPRVVQRERRARVEEPPAAEAPENGARARRSS